MKKSGRKKGKIGIQLSTIRPKIEQLGVYEAMKRCADLGFHCVEISQVAMTQENLEAFVKAQSDFDIQVAAINAVTDPIAPGMENLRDHYEKIVSDARALKCDMLRMGSGPIFDLHSEQDVLDWCSKVNLFCDRLKADGLDYYYRNHAFEFQRFGGKTMLELLRDHAKIGFELDIHWIHTGGADPVSVIREFAGRIRLLHLKDYRIVYPNVDLNEMRRQGINPQYLGIQFAEVGEGSLDISGSIEAGLEGGSEYFLIEQDRTYDRDPFDSLAISRDNLIRLGYGEWF